MKVIDRIAIGLFVAGGVVALVCAAWFLSGGVGARQAPSAAEARIARAIRHRAIPGSARRDAMPFPSTAEVLQEGRSHFADHCASCHGNDGKATTEIGQNLSPRVPDMTRKETQDLSDGELFFIIKNGVRLTGMPAWGKDTPEDDQASWRLVAFIRHLPAATPAELEQMKRMNPVSPAEIQEQQQIDNFLEGDDSPPPQNTTPAASHGH